MNNIICHSLKNLLPILSFYVCNLLPMILKFYDFAYTTDKNLCVKKIYVPCFQVSDYYTFPEGHLAELYGKLK